MYITKDRPSKTSYYRKLDQMLKNLLRRQNPLELVFKDISTFDSQNLINESLVKETEIRENDTANELVKITLNLLDIELHLKLNNLEKLNDSLDGKKRWRWRWFVQQQQQKKIISPGIPNFELNNIQSEISNFPLLN